MNRIFFLKQFKNEQINESQCTYFLKKNLGKKIAIAQTANDISEFHSFLIIYFSKFGLPWYKTSSDHLVLQCKLHAKLLIHTRTGVVRTEKKQKKLKIVICTLRTQIQSKINKGRLN